jgi:hypothetical protein
MVLVLSALLGLVSRQVDYTQAFPQAPLDDPVFMKIPQGWYYNTDSNTLEQHPDDPKANDHDHFIRLKRNLYGCKQAARNWYLHLKTGLLGRGFVQSTVDPCLFIRKDCLIVLYTDDCLLFANDTSTIDALCESLSTDFLLKDEGNINDFLGINITHELSDTGDVKIHLTQTGLIDQILQDVGLTSNNHQSRAGVKFVPAQEILHPNPNAAPFNAPWNYRSIIGKLNFLAQNTRPDISMAVHQCARFVNAPNQVHQNAVKYLCRYLLLTRTKGIIFTPTADHRLNAFVDSDFAGLWSHGTAHLRESALSRTGYVITYCNCPILWASKLQSEVAISTTEAEYIALSMCMRELIPFHHLLNEISKGFVFNTLGTECSLVNGSTSAFTRMHQSVIYEDNAGCLELARNPEQYRPRTKHIGIKFHHFRDQVSNGSIVVTKIDTTLNWADLLTKPTPRIRHEALRLLFLGW